MNSRRRPPKWILSQLPASTIAFTLCQEKKKTENLVLNHLCLAKLIRAKKSLKALQEKNLKRSFDKRLLNPIPNKPWFFSVWNTSLLKTLREKDKLLVTSNFSFSHSVFYPF